MKAPRLSVVIAILAVSASNQICAEDLSPKLDPSGGHEVRMDGGCAVVDIRCPKGIGRTAVHAGKDGWPEKIVLRLHLKGLEGFELRGEKCSLSSSYGSTKGAGAMPTSKRLHGEGAESEILAKDDPYHLTIKPVSEKPIVIPLDGYFEIEVPTEFLRDHPSSFKLHWIDFYR